MTARTTQPATAPQDGAAQRATLAEALERLGLARDDDTLTRLLAYLALLAKWNRVYNLTAIRDPHAMLVQHLLDCLAIVDPLRRRAPANACIVAVGSGAGLPGIPLAIAWPHARVHLVETVGKKAAFLQQARLELGLANVSVHAARVETLELAGADLVVSRAFASLAAFARASSHLAGAQTKLAAMKAALAQDELDEFTARAPDWTIPERIALDVPLLAAARELVLMRRRASVA